MVLVDLHVFLGVPFVLLIVILMFVILFVLGCCYASFVLCCRRVDTMLLYVYRSSQRSIPVRLAVNNSTHIALRLADAQLAYRTILEISLVFFSRRLVCSLPCFVVVLISTRSSLRGVVLSCWLLEIFHEMPDSVFAYSVYFCVFFDSGPVQSRFRYVIAEYYV